MPQNVKHSGVDDMVLLPKISEEAIVDNLRKRYLDDYIYTYIGPVLISVNPFKEMSYFGDKEIELYQGAAPFENPPHIYALADELYRNMMIDKENQCVIISGESGAGKTVSAKYIMSYITKVSGGGTKVQHVKEMVLKSNPLLEAFGNAKTVKNNNSSRFGKYVEILFELGGQPVGGKISNFLLEKSRVIIHNKEERNFHIFYQLCSGADDHLRRELGIFPLTYYCYLSYGINHTIPGISDGKNFQEVLKAMSTMNLSVDEQKSILKVTAAVLHLGNIHFCEKRSNATIINNEFLSYPAYLLDIKENELHSKLISRKFDSKWGSEMDTIKVPLNIEQATYTRDALAKAIYSRLFDYLVNAVNEAMSTNAVTKSIGILDIYGFEILDENGFEQFCINFVNEKLQQIFIELTLKSEQEEYATEKIEWTPIDYFNNKVVCDLIEGKRPPGIFCVLDDVCATLHAVSAGADLDLLKQLNNTARTHDHYEEGANSFVIHHYAGKVTYSIEDFCDKNRDVLFPDLVLLMQSSESAFVRKIFAKDGNNHSKGRPTTVGSKIRSQTKTLMETLSNCRPHYVRCIKPNDSKKPRDWNEQSVKHQVEYLGLKENIRVRRAGFAYRRSFSKFLFRYGILNPKKPNEKCQVDNRTLVERIMTSLNISVGLYQLGLTKVFIKAPETLFMLEEQRERKYNYYARVLQKAFKKYFVSRQFDKQKIEAAQLLFGKKERRENSINRNFVGDYIGLDCFPVVQSLIGRREKVVFAETVKKYDRNFKSSHRDLVLTRSLLYLIGREKVKKGKNKGGYQEVVKRKIEFESIADVSLSTLKDDFVLIHVVNAYDSLLEIMFKTEFLYRLSRQYYLKLGRNLNIIFSNQLEFRVKQEGWGGAGTRFVNFMTSSNHQGLGETLKNSGKSLVVIVPEGLPNTSVPIIKNNSSPNIKKVVNNKTSIESNKIKTGSVPSATPYIRAAPPPPSEPAPPNQPLISSFRFNYQRLNKRKNNEEIKENEMEPLRKGFSKAVIVHGVGIGTESDCPKEIVSNGEKIKPLIKSKPKMLPKCKAVYDYEAQDVDELSFESGNIIEIIKEHEGGWWQGRLRGKEGLFPSNYVEKI